MQSYRFSTKYGAVSNPLSLLCCNTSRARRPRLNVLLQVRDARILKKELAEAGKDLVPILEGNLVDVVWGSAQPQPPATSLRPHKLEFAGQSVAEKVEEMQKKLEGDAHHWTVTCMPA